ncbi:MAG: hypothetical protein LC808_40620, partial [Actinobacteria bacterium]|nr:hypothetical protein [Actinomycetota bacterium]
MSEELVTSAVKATGVMDEHVHWTEVTRINFITVHLLCREDSIRIEVWDSATNRGCYATADGKVVWAE